MTWSDLLASARKSLPEPLHPSFEAAELLARAAGRPRSWFQSRLRETAPEGDAKRFSELVARREAGEPLQYLLGEWEFLGRTFSVDPRALIPRGETEGIIEIARSAAPDAKWILDLGTGSGILAVTLALERPAARIVALDVSASALALAVSNARRHRVAERVFPIASDWLRAIQNAATGIRTFDLIVSNPPYVPSEDAAHLDKTVSDHEPHVALFGGDDGLDPLRLLLEQIPAVLGDGAPFLFEFGYGQAREVTKLVEGSGSFTLSAVRLDAAGIPRTATAIRKRRSL